MKNPVLIRDFLTRFSTIIYTAKKCSTSAVSDMRIPKKSEWRPSPYTGHGSTKWNLKNDSRSCADVQNTINTTMVNLTIVTMQQKSLREQMKEFGSKEWAQIVFMILIMIAGGYLIIYSVYMMTVNNDPGLFMFSIAMFGVGCTTIWFALSHVEIQSTEEKLESITNRLDKIIDRIEKQ